MKFKSILYIILILSPLMFWAVGTPPQPYYRYELSGYLYTYDEKIAPNYTLVLYGRENENSAYLRLDSIETIDYVVSPDKAVAISAPNGFFKIRITPKLNKLKDIKLAVMLNNKTTYYIGQFEIDSVKKKEITDYFTYSNESGCSCDNTTSSQEVVIGYLIQFPVKTYKVPV